MKIFELFTLIYIITSFILIGSPLQYNATIINIIAIIIGSIYFLLILKKKKIQLEKIDILVLLYLLSPIIPIITNQYIDLESTLLAVLKSISLFNVYFILKNIIKEDNTFSKKVISSIIISGIILIIFGIDELSSKSIVNVLASNIHTYQIINEGNRMFSTINYPNTFAIIIAICFILGLDRLDDIKLKYKEKYSSFIFICLFALIRSYSTGTAIFLIIIFIMYFIKRKNKVYLSYCIVFNFILAIIFVKIFDKLVLLKNDIFIWYILIIFCLISFFTAKALFLLIDKIEKIKIKYYILFFIGLIISIFGFVFIGLKYTDSLHCFNNGEKNDTIQYNLYGMKPSKEYVFDFDIKAKVLSDNSQRTYCIKIEELDLYYDVIKIHTKLFNNYDGNLKMVFNPQERSKAFRLYFISQKKDNQDGLIVESLKINDEDYILNYKYLPTFLVKRLEAYRTEHSAIRERLAFYRDGLKIVKNHLFTGIGGEGWDYEQKNVQSYNYYSKEVHNYYLEILINNGIISFILLLVIVIYYIIIIIKRYVRNESRTVDYAFLLLTVHCIMDFDMSFYCVQVLWIILFTFVIYNKDNIILEEKKILKLIIYVIIILSNIIALLAGSYLLNYKNIKEKFSRNIKTSMQTDMNESVNIIKNDKTHKDKMMYYQYLNLIDYSKVSDENIEYMYNMLKNQKIIVDTNYNMQKNLLINQIINTLTNEKNRKDFADIIISENELMIKNIKNQDYNRLTKNQIDYTLIIQENIYKNALMALN